MPFQVYSFLVPRYNTAKDDDEEEEELESLCSQALMHNMKTKKSGFGQQRRAAAKKNLR